MAQDGAPVGAAAPPASPAAIPPRIDTSVFAAIPALSGFRVSPDGRSLLARNIVEGKERLAIIHLTGGEKPLIIALPDEQELVYFRWAGSRRVLISLAVKEEFYGEDVRVTRLVVYDIATRTMRPVGRMSQGFDGDNLVHVDPEGGWVLLSVQKSIFDYPSVERVDLATGEITQAVRARQDIGAWIADNKGVVRMGLGYADKRFRIYYRPSEAEDFRLIAKPKADDENAFFELLRIYQGTDEGYVLSSRETGRYALHKFNLATRELGEKVYDHPTNDLDDFDTTEDGRSLLYARYTDDRARIHWFDETFAALQGGIDSGLKDRLNMMTSWSEDKSVIMVWTGDSDDPGRYYVFQPGLGTLKRYFVPYPDLKPADLTKSRYVSYKARDGLEIPAYLTLPKGREAKGLPLVILPHGGPFEVRDDLSFNTEVQMLANRGYAVLQPNFRGSGGYGKVFSDKGYGQIGRTMQDDLDDGMDWLVSQGIVDARRVCIVGASYGGYAALWGAIRNPERYRCAASFAGVTDLRRQLKYDIDFLIARKYQNDWREKVRGAEAFDLASVSPVQQAARLQVPVLIAHGERDTTVPPRQGKLLADALKKAGKSFEYHTYPEGGHGWSKSEDFKDWLDRLDAFLAKHNPA